MIFDAWARVLVRPSRATLSWEAESSEYSVSNTFNAFSVCSSAIWCNCSRFRPTSLRAARKSLAASSMPASSGARRMPFSSRCSWTTDVASSKESLTRSADLSTSSSMLRSSLLAPTRATVIDADIRARSRTNVTSSLVLIVGRTAISQPLKLGRYQRLDRREDTADVEDHHELIVSPPYALNELWAPARPKAGHLVGDHGIEVGDLVDLVGQNGRKGGFALEGKFQNHNTAVDRRLGDRHAAAQAKIGQRRHASTEVDQVGDEGRCVGNRRDRADIEDFEHDARGKREDFAAQRDGEDFNIVGVGSHARFRASRCLEPLLAALPEFDQS